MSRLSELLMSALPVGWTGNGISRAAQAKGYTLSPTTVLAYLSGGQAQRPSDQVLRAFADVLRLDLDTLRAAAAEPPPAEPYQPPAQAHRLDSRAQAAVTELIRLLAENHATAGAPILKAHGSGIQPTPGQLDAANEIVGLLTAAQELTHEKLGEDAFAWHLGTLIDQLIETFGRDDLSAVEITLPAKTSAQEARPPGARQRA